MQLRTLQHDTENTRPSSFFTLVFRSPSSYIYIYIWFHRFSFLLRRRHIGRYFVWTVYCYVIHDRYKYINGFASIAFTTFFCTNRNIPMRILQYKSFGNDVSHHALLYKLTFIVRAQCTYYKLSREFTNIYRYTVKQS